jgi:hypothetical protein
VDLTSSDPVAIETSVLTIEEVCQREHQAMLAWADESIDDQERLKPRYDGTLGSLVDLYLSDKESSYQRLKENSQVSYAEWLDLIRRTIGLRRIDRIQAKYFRTCYDEWRKRGDGDPRHRTRTAYGCIQMIKILLNYGIETSNLHAKRLREGLETMRFEKNPPREETMTYAYSAAVVDHCLAVGDWHMALCQAVEWDTGLRQKDVIGQWRSQSEPYQMKPGEIRYGRRIWSGLTLDQIHEGAELVVRTSKTGQRVAHRISKCELIMRCIPFIDRSDPRAPVALNSRGTPWADHRAFGKAWRRRADAAGVPATTWNMDNRAGALSEASAGGAADDDLAANAGHSDKSMVRRVYKRRAIEASDRVQESRRVARANSPVAKARNSDSPGT